MLSVSNLSCGILKDISFSLGAGECLAFCGPSGSGKTTLLNAIAGNIAYSGTINFENKDLKRIRQWHRPFRYLNQRLYLFPYLSIGSNLRLAQFASGMPDDGKQRQLVLQKFGISHLAKSLPGRVSGGEQQRAAFARAVITSPRLLLLDEPCSSLDWELREKLWDVLRDIRKKLKFSILLVSHDPREVEALSDRRIYIDKGTIAR